MQSEESGVGVGGYGGGGGGGGGGEGDYNSCSAYSLFSQRTLLAGSVCPTRSIRPFPVSLQFVYVPLNLL